MARVLQYVSDHPGCTKGSAAAESSRGIRYGYAAVERCITSGLVRTERPDGYAYQCYLTELGASALRLTRDGKGSGRV